MVKGQICRLDITKTISSVRLCRLMRRGDDLTSGRPWWHTWLLDEAHEFGAWESELTPVTDPHELALIELAYPTI